MEEHTQFARKLRGEQTLAEAKLWSRLRNRQLNGWKFKRQKPIGGFIVDFVCLETKLIVEVDGSQHQEQVRYDQERTRFLESEGYKVLRFWNNDVLKDTDAALTEILNYLPPHPSPLPGGERE